MICINNFSEILLQTPKKLNNILNEDIIFFLIFFIQQM